MWSVARLVMLTALAASVLAVSGTQVGAQDKDDKKKDDKKIEVKFKLFDTNKPDSTRPIEPKEEAELILRDPKTKRQAFPKPVKVEPAGDGFYKVLVDKDVLIERLTIESKDIRYSPADVTKVITKAPSVLYPGASDSEDQFHFSAYIAQMNTYKSILTELFSAVPDQQEAIRELYARKFTYQLRNLEKVPETPGRLLDATPDETQAALKLADEVLKLYGLRADTPPYYPCPQPQPLYYCVPRPRCCWSSCWCR